jgi:hypothetical protein
MSVPGAAPSTAKRTRFSAKEKVGEIVQGLLTVCQKARKNTINIKAK